MSVAAMLRRGISLALLVVLLAGCAGPSRTPVGLTEIPSPPGATVYNGDAENLIDGLLLAAHAAYGDETLQVDDQLYLFPTSEAGAAGLTFFTSALPPQGWTPRTEAALAGSRGQAWQRGDQRLTVALVEVGTSTIVVVLLSTPR